MLVCGLKPIWVSPPSGALPREEPTLSSWPLICAVVLVDIMTVEAVYAIGSLEASKAPKVSLLNLCGGPRDPAIPKGVVSKRRYKAVGLTLLFILDKNKYMSRKR